MIKHVLVSLNILSTYYVLSILHMDRAVFTQGILGTLLGVQDHKKVKFPGRDISSLAFKGLHHKHTMHATTHCIQDTYISL